MKRIPSFLSPMLTRLAPAPALWLPGMLLLCALLMLLANGLTQHQLNQQRKQFQQQQQRLLKQQNALRQQQLDKDFLHQHAGEIQQLRELGLLRTPQRKLWIEQLLAVHQQLALPATLSYTLAPAQAIASASLPTATNQPAPPDSLWQHELHIDLRDIHEVELLEFLELLGQYTRAVNAPFQLRACQLSQPKSTGLHAQCQLRFFSLPSEMQDVAA